MQYYVIAPDGQKYGPADVPTLAQWAQEGRLDASTMLESALDGSRSPAASVPGIIAASAGNPYATPAPGPQTTYSGPVGGAYDDGSGDVTKAWIFGALGIVCCGIILCPIGIYFGSQAVKKGNPSGRAAMIFSICTTVLWVVLAIWRVSSVLSVLNR